VLPTALLAIVVPPNEADSMAYHMARVVNWIQDHNVQHYPTYYIHQIAFPPLSSFIILHLQLLSGGDYLANLVQWFSMIGSVIGVSYIAKQLGAKPTGQTFSALVCATIPTGILQSSTTQNDYVTSFWLVCFVSNVLWELTQPGSVRTSLETGCSLGLSILTKTTAYVYNFPFYLLFLGILLYRRGKKVWQPLALSTLPVLLLNAGHTWRNYSFSGTLLGIKEEGVRNKLLDMDGFISIFSRNIALHLAIPNQTFNDIVFKLLKLLHQGIGLDLSDPRTTMDGHAFQMPPASPILLSENVTGNPLHLLLILVTIGLYIGYKKLRSRLLTHYLIALLFIFVLLSFLVKWYVAGSRYQLPIFVLFSAFSGTVIAVSIVQRFLHYLLAVLLLFSAVPYVVFNTAKPILLSKEFTLAIVDNSSLETSRTSQYFNNLPNLRIPYQAAADTIAAYQCKEIGLYYVPGGWPIEYPLWALLKQHETSQYKVNFQSVGVKNSSALIKANTHPSRIPSPCAVLRLGPTGDSETQLSFQGIQYQKVPSPSLASVYVDTSKIDVSSNPVLFLPPNSTLNFFESRAKADETSINYPNSILYQGEGWSSPETRGTWTDGSLARLDLPFQSIPSSGLKVSATIKNVFLSERHPQQTVEVRVNGELVTTWTFTLGQPLLQNYVFQIPAAVAQQQTPLLMTLHILDPKSPQELDLSSDSRKLGIVLNRLMFLSQ